MLPLKTIELRFGRYTRYTCQVNDAAAGRQLACTLPARDRNRALVDGMRLVRLVKL